MVKGFAVFTPRGGLVWGTISPEEASAWHRFCDLNPVRQFPEQYATHTVQPVTITPDRPPKKAARCRETADLFEG